MDVSKTVKFAYIDYTPATASPMRKALLSTHKGQVEDLMKPFHVSMQVDCVEELDESVILDKIGISSGTKSHVKADLTWEEKKERSTVKKPQAKKIPAMVPNSIRDERAVEIEGEDELRSGIEKVRDDADDTNWVLANYKDDHETIQFVGTGSNGISELVSHMDDSTVYFAFFRTEEVFDKSTTVKFSFVRLLSDKVPPLKRAKQSTHFGFVTSVFEPFHVEFVIDDVSELSEEIVSNRVRAVMGKTDNLVSKDDARLRKSSSNTEKKVNHVPVGGTDDEIKFADGTAVLDAINDVRSDSSSTSWMSAKYSAKYTLSLNGSGEGGVDALLATFEDTTTVNFGLLRVTDQIDKSTTVKFVYIKFQPESVKPMKKAEISTKKGLIDDIFTPFHVDFFISSKDEISQALVDDKVSSASGSKSHVVQD